MESILRLHKKSIWCAVFGLALIATVVIPVQAAGAALKTTTCELTPQVGRIIVDFGDNRLLSSSSLARAMAEVNTNISAGTYTITLMGWDGYANRVNVTQPNEQYFLQLFDGSTLVAETDSISDIPDKVAQATVIEQVNANFVIAQDITKAVAFHAVYPDVSSANSLHAVCAAFDKIEEEPETHSISGMKFNDENADGGKDAGELGLENWSINLEGPGALVASTTTDAAGAYEFTDLEPGDYELCETQQTGWNQTFPTTASGCHEIEITNANISDIDFGNAEEGEPPCTVNCGSPPPPPPPSPGCISNCGGGGGPGSPVLIITKTVEKAYTFPGDTVQYTVTVKNITSAVARNVILTDELPVGFLHVTTSSSTQEWSLGDLGLNDEAVTIFEVLVQEGAVHGDHVNIATAKADNHIPVSDDATIGIGGTPPPPEIPELPETGVSFMHIAVWGNMLLLTILLAAEVASFVVTGDMVFPRNFAFVKSAETKLFAVAGAGTMGVIILAGVLAYPFVPMAAYSNSPQALVSEATWTEALESQGQDTETVPEEFLQENYLVIPSIGVKVPIAEGADATALKQGAWRLPTTSNPEQGSNMALAAHRFRWNPPYEHTLYHLDKLQEGDLVQVFWKGKEYRYRMVSAKVVAPSAVEVLNPTANPTVTLITCNPIFSVQERLVVAAELVEVV